MSARDEYPPGVPCWVETLQPQPAAALDFYGPLLGWEFAAPEPMPGGMPGHYYVAHVKGRSVAGIGTLPDLGGPPTAVWNTYVAVDDVVDTVERAKAAGGTVLTGPLDGHPSGHFAVLADPAGAAISTTEPDARPSARLVNEPRTWAMSSLHTTDGPGAIAFYEAVFGWLPQIVGAPEAPLALLRLPAMSVAHPGNRSRATSSP